MANKSLRCLRASGSSGNSKQSTAEVLSVMERYELMDLLRAKRGNELNQMIKNKSTLSRKNSDSSLSFDGIDDGKSSSMMSSIGDREDLDFHDDVFVRESDGSSTGSSYKPLNLRMSSSHSSENLCSRSAAHNSFSDPIYAPQENSDSSISGNDDTGSERPTSSTIESLTETAIEKKAVKSTDIRDPSPKGVSVGGGQSKISKFPERNNFGTSSATQSQSKLKNEAQRFFSRASTGIRSSNQEEQMVGLSSSSSGSHNTGGSSNKNDHDHDFFSPVLTGIRSSPRLSDEGIKARKLESKLRQIEHKSKRSDGKVKEKDHDINANAVSKLRSTNSIKKDIMGRKAFLKDTQVAKNTDEVVTEKEESRHRGNSQLLALEAMAKLEQMRKLKSGPDKASDGQRKVGKVDEVPDQSNKGIVEDV